MYGLIKFFFESKSFPTMRTTAKVERVVSPRLGSWEHGISVKISSENDESKRQTDGLKIAGTPSISNIETRDLPGRYD